MVTVRANAREPQIGEPTSSAESALEANGATVRDIIVRARRAGMT